MSALALTLAVLQLAATVPSPRQTAAQQAASSCIVCHGAEGLAHARSTHAAAGIGCLECHGGVEGPLEVKAAHGEQLQTLSTARGVVASCGGCHADLQHMRQFGLRTDQLSLYETSPHGLLLAKDKDAPVATCISCHGSHDVLAASDPRSPIHDFRQPETCGACHADEALMGAYGLRSDTVERYRHSVHGVALLDKDNPAAPACTDCHGSHGAAPPRVTDIEMVCGTCHSTVREFYEQSAHFARSAQGVDVQCASCHNNHDVQVPETAAFVGEEHGQCGSCHMAGEPDSGMQTAVRLRDALLALQNTIAQADGEVRAAARLGLFLGDERGYLDEARSLLVRARSMTHSLQPEDLDDVLDLGRGMVRTTRDGLQTKQRNLRDRRIFTGIFFAVALAFAGALLLYAREIRNRWRETPPVSEGDRA